MAEVPRGRPRGKKKTTPKNKKEISHQRDIRDIRVRNQISRQDFYGGAASRSHQRPTDTQPRVSYSRSYQHRPRQQRVSGNSYKLWKKSHRRRKKSRLRGQEGKRAGGRSFRWGKFSKFLIIVLVLVFVGSFALSSTFRTSVVSGVYAHIYTLSHDDPQLAEDIDSEVSGNGIVYTTQEVEVADLHRGDLILVNNQHAYDFEANADLIQLVSMNEEHHDSFSIYEEQEVATVMMNALNQMFDDFYAATGNDQVRVISSYRSQEYQESLYENKIAEVGQEMTESWAALPGYSEHHTGLAVDIGIASGEGATTFTTEGDYGWVAKNCYKYGLVNRYDESKQDITGIMDEPWHYRYVGVPHAYVMYSKNLCLEEYIESLKYYNYKGEHLEVTGDDGTQYEIYYVNSRFYSGVPVPKNYEYTLSGNNVDGYIVTVNMSRPVE